MTKMFTIDGKPMSTWNVLIGCLFNCIYCNVRVMVRTRLKDHPRYQEGMKPRLVPELLARRFRAGMFVFIGYMGDIACQPKKNIQLVLEVVNAFPKTWFMFCTKNPAVYSDWGLELPANLYCGATIESNIDHGVTKAPAPAERYRAMAALEHPYKFISIEPVMDFDLKTMVAWIKEIGPRIVEIGPDNYHNNLPEPSKDKTRMLLEMTREICPTVVEKPRLSRLTGIS